MATTVEKVILDSRALLNNLSDDGDLIADEEVADYILSAIRFVDLGQKELFRVGNYRKNIEYTHYPTQNELGSQFNLVENIGDDQYYPNESGIANIGSYHVEANATHSIIIQELESGSWSDLITQSGTKATIYKGNITPTTSGNKIRMKMVGGTYYTHKNRALFKPSYASDDDVPSYAKVIMKTLPDDFKRINMVSEETDCDYSQSASYGFESTNRFYFDYDFKGTVRIVYTPIPTTITDSDQELEIDDIAAIALSYYVASWSAPYKNKSLATPLSMEYEKLKAELFIIEPAKAEEIEDVYGGY